MSKDGRFNEGGQAKPKKIHGGSKHPVTVYYLTLHCIRGSHLLLCELLVLAETLHNQLFTSRPLVDVAHIVWSRLVNTVK